LTTPKLIRHADYSGPDPDPEAGRVRPDGSIAPRTVAWPLSHVEVEGDLWESHVFSDQLANQGLDEGWIRYDGKPLKYEVQPDPLHPDTRYLSPQKIELPGDHLVLRIVHGDALVDVTYKILAGPIPRHFRIPDPDDPSGFASWHEFRVEFVSEEPIGGGKS